MPENAVYRKFTIEHGWQDFVENGSNSISSGTSVNGICPPPHSELYSAGLTKGYDCLRLIMEDGGPNDADTVANGTIDDPGGLAIISNKELTQSQDPVQSSSGGTFNILVILLFIITSRKYYLFKK